MTEISISPWDGQHASACQIFDLAEQLGPVAEPMDRAGAVQFINTLKSDIDGSALVATLDGKLVGFSIVGTLAANDTAKLWGGVHPDYRRQGLGSRLLNASERSLRGHSEISYIAGGAHQSCSASHRFFEHWGFDVIDVQVWSAYSLQRPLQPWVVQKIEAFQGSEYRIVSGEVFRSLRTDWAQACWRLNMDTARDIPSRIPFEEVPFDDWLQFMASTELSLFFFVLDGLEPIAFLRLGKPVGGAVNIGFTGVDSNYRRGGLSLALKVKAIEKARAMGVKSVTTQNHQDNPMLALNKQFGFEVFNTFTEYLRPIR